MTDAGDLTHNQKVVLLTLSLLPKPFATDRLFFEKVLFLLNKSHPERLPDLDATLEDYRLRPHNEYGDSHLADGRASVMPLGRLCHARRHYQGTRPAIKGQLRLRERLAPIAKSSQTPPDATGALTGSITRADPGAGCRMSRATDSPRAVSV